MKGFHRAVKDAVYMGCKTGFFGILVCMVMSGWFRLMELGANIDFSGMYANGNLFIIYGVTLILFQGALYTTNGLKTQLSMGCTRRHAVYGNAVMSLVLSAILIAGILVIGLIQRVNESGTPAGNLIRNASLLFIGSGIGAIMGVVVDRFGKWAYNIAIIICCVGIGVYTSLTVSGDVKISLEFLQSPVLTVIAVMIFLGGYFILGKYVSKLDVKL